MQIFIISVKDFQFNLDLIFDYSAHPLIMTIGIRRCYLPHSVINMPWCAINMVKDVKSTSVRIESLF